MKILSLKSAIGAGTFSGQHRQKVRASMSTLKQTIKTIVKKIEKFTERGGGITLRFYQSQPAKAIINSIRKKLGLTIVIIICRQAGKDELLANLIAYLLLIFAHRDLGIVIANPTYKPQTINAIMRLERRLNSNLLTKTLWGKRSDFMRYIGNCTASFLSADASANVVGAVASLLEILNEAQDIAPEVADKRFEPMRASTNATKVVVGTTWTSRTYLARELRAAREAEKKDGLRRVFIYNVNDVRKVNPAYGKFVDEQVRKLGRQHPLVKTQYFCEEIDAIASMFHAGRLALMQAPAIDNPQPEDGHTYCIIMDIGGQDEAMLELDGMSNPGRDYIQLAIVDVDLSSLEIAQAPTYHIIKRLEWQGVNHVNIFSAVSALVQAWNALYIVLDATGVGEGLWGMFAKKYPTKTIGVKFTQQTKSEIGYAYLGIVDTGRLRDHCHTETVNEQYVNCTSEILIGPAKTMRWGVKDGTRGADGLLVHDDCILCDSLVTELDKLEWYVSAQTVVIEQPDVLEQMDHAY